MGQALAWIGAPLSLPCWPNPRLTFSPIALPFQITVNVADTLQILSGEYLKSSVHRVHVPPADQAQFDRIGVLYFVRPSNDVAVEVVEGSPVLEAEGVYEKLKNEEPRPKLTVAGASLRRAFLVTLCLCLTTDTSALSLSHTEWVKFKQADIFSKEASARYAKLIADRGIEQDGKERRDLETTVAGIKVKYYA